MLYSPFFLVSRKRLDYLSTLLVFPFGQRHMPEDMTQKGISDLNLIGIAILAKNKSVQPPIFFCFFGFG